MRNGETYWYKRTKKICKCMSSMPDKTEKWKLLFFLILYSVVSTRSDNNEGSKTRSRLYLCATVSEETAMKRLKTLIRFVIPPGYLMYSRALDGSSAKCLQNTTVI